MTKIILHTRIKAPIDRVFDLARSIELHKLTTTGTNEKVIEGRTSGLLEVNETVTWKARHLGVTQTLTVRITEADRPNFFKDVMIKGAFKSMKHTHTFKLEEDETIMTDNFEFESPLGLIGKAVNYFFLKRYMTNFLKNKNTGLKMAAESDEWKKILKK